MVSSVPQSVPAGPRRWVLSHDHVCAADSSGSRQVRALQLLAWVMTRSVTPATPSKPTHSPLTRATGMEGGITASSSPCSASPGNTPSEPGAPSPSCWPGHFCGDHQTWDNSKTPGIVTSVPSTRLCRAGQQRCPPCASQAGLWISIPTHLKLTTKPGHCWPRPPLKLGCAQVLVFKLVAAAPTLLQLQGLRGLGLQRS